MVIPERTGSASVARYRPLWRTTAIPWEVWALAALTALAAVLRFATLTSQSYWADEATTVHEMALSLGALLHQVRVNETTPPLYFVLAWLWTKLFGTSEAGLRSLCALAGTALVPVTYLCGREIVSRRVGLLAAALAACSPFMIWYSQEGRSYMLFALFCGVSVLFCARSWSEPSARNLAWWTAASSLAVLTHFFAGFLIAPEALLLLVAARTRAVFASIAAVAVVQLAVLPLAISDTSHPLGWIKQFPLAVRIKQVPVDLALSSLYQKSSLVQGGLIGAALVAAIAIVLVALGGGRRERRGAAFAAAIGGFAVLVPLVLAALGGDYVVPRNFIAAWLPLAVVLAAAFTAPRAREAGAALAAMTLAAFLYSHAWIERHPQYQRPDWRAVASALGDARRTRAVVAYDGLFAAQPLAVYLRGAPWPSASANPVSVSEVDVVGSSWQSNPARLPPGARLLSRKVIGGLLVDRFLVQPAWTLAPGAIGARAGSLLAPAPAAPVVLIQHAYA